MKRLAMRKVFLVAVSGLLLSVTVGCNDDQPCGEQNGFICPAELECGGDWLSAGDTERCCSVECAAETPDQGQPDLMPDMGEPDVTPDSTDDIVAPDSTHDTVTPD